MRDLTTVLLEWEAAKTELEAAKANEMKLRKEAFALGFGDQAKEGTNTIELGGGYELKGAKKLSYKLEKPLNYEGTVISAVQNVCDRFALISNQGAYIAERLFKWSVYISITEYRRLVEDARQDKAAQRMLKELEKVLVIVEAAPTLEIKAPKK